VLTESPAKPIGLLPMLAIGHAGTKYGIPYAVLARSSFGTTGARLWIIDPIDGTRGFAQKNGEFSVMIGFVEHGNTVACDSRSIGEIPRDAARATKWPRRPYARRGRLA